MEQRIFRSLLNPSAYPEPATAVRLIQTHVSLIFLTDNYVYKIKKPVDLGFLDFTSLQQRRFYCEEEVRLNRRLCPDMYLGVVEVRDSEAAPLGPEGKVVDYAVKMRRLPEERMLDRLLERGEVTPADIRRIARTIGEFHNQAERNAETDSLGSWETINLNWQENFRQLEEFSSVTIAARDLQIIRDWVSRFMEENRDVFSRRIANGHIRDCNGDIHMENICLTDQVLVFDCIEFNKRFRYSDTAADIAFLLMDFDFAGAPLFSDVFLQEYLAVTGDRDINRVLDFYKIYRAVVRGKVESFRLHDPDIPDGEKAAARERATRYLHLARGYILRGKLPLTLIITCGLMGSGKSTVASRLSSELGLERFSSDLVRKELSSVPPYSHDYSGYGKGIYDGETTTATYQRLLDRTSAALGAGRSAIVDATFRKRTDRAMFRALAREKSAGFFILYLSAPEGVLEERLDARLASPGEISDGRRELLRSQQEEFEPPGLDEQGQIYLDTALPLHDTMDIILQRTGLL